MLIFDRPRPTNHEYKSVNFIVSFSWVENNSSIPVSGKVQTENKPDEIRIYEPSTAWSSLDVAREDVVSQFKKTIDDGAL